MFALVLALATLGGGGTPAYAWTESAPLNSNAGVDTGDDWMSEVTTDGLGHWVAVWKTNDDLGDTIGHDGDIVVSRSTDNGATWTALAPLNTNATTDAGHDSYPQVTTDGLGHWVAVWESNDDLGGTIGHDGDILVSRSSDNGATWTAPAALNTNAASDSGYDGVPQLTTDRLGHWVAVWQSTDDLGGTIDTDWDILVASSTDNGANWTDPAPLNSNPDSLTRDDYEPQVTTDGLGHWVAVWHSIDSEGDPIGTDLDILVARSTDNGATWTDPAPLNTNAATDTGDDTAPQVTTDNLGHWVAVWTSDEDLGGIDTDLDILVSRSTDNGTTWTAPAALKNNNGADWCPQVTTDGVGQWVAVWESNTLSGPPTWDEDILISRSTNNGATWTAAAALNTNAASDNTRYDRGPQVTTDGLGHWVAVWNSYDSLGGPTGTDYDILYATEYTPPSAGKLLLTLTTPNPIAGAYFGNPAVGDVNGDGKGEIVVGAINEKMGANNQQGQAYVFSSDGSLLHTLNTPNPQGFAHFGNRVAVGGGLIVVGAWGEQVGPNGGQGRVYVFSGATGSLLHTLEKPIPAQADAGFGCSVAVGDVDGDTTADIAVGACREDVDVSPNRGRAYVFSGADWSLLFTLNAPNGVQDGLFGVSVAIGRVDDDSYGDIVVGASRSNVGAVSAQGRAYVFSGASGSLLRTLDSPNGETSGEFGWSVALGRVNSDSNADIVVAAHFEDVSGAAGQGRAYVFSGADWSLLYTLTTPEATPFAEFGCSVAVGDVNADGRGDIAVGACSEKVGGNNLQGRAYVFSGANRSLLLALDTPNPQAIAYFGSPVAVGDVNGDGGADIAVGATSETVGGNVAQGRAYVFSAGGVPPGGTDGFDVEFNADDISYPLGDPQGPFHADGAATIERGPPHWSDGRQCANFTMKSMTLTGTLGGIRVVIRAGEGLPYGVPVSTGVICEDSPESDIDLDLYVVVEVQDPGGTFYLINPHNRIMSTCYCGGGTGVPPPEACLNLCPTSPSGEICSNTDTDDFPLADPADPYTVVAEVTPSEEEGEETCSFLFAPVGGIAEWPGATAGPDSLADSSAGSGFNYTALGAALGAAAVALAAGAWLARRRWVR